jgi:putative ABC transport system ATP-binding protein
MKPLIQLKQAKKSYALKNMVVPVLRGVDLIIEAGEFVAIMGESGGGKSTLMNILGCLHPLTGGEYFFEGVNIGNVQDDNTLSFIRNQKMGFIFQQFNLIGKLSALKNVALPGFYAGKSQTEREDIATKLLNSVGLGDRLNYKPNELSGGQQQRVSIARALINDPEIILADEPTGALDSETGKEILELFHTFKKKNKTVIMITHDANVARQAERIIFMKDGRVIDSHYQLPN